VAAALVARQTGRGNLLSFDMGGTTAKASLIRDGQYETTPEYEVGGGSSRSRWMHGTGHPIRVSVIDLAEVSAGGGSIAWVDRAGSLRVGPRSAGADPGPVCYGRGGTEPTVTDCDLLLGYLDKGSLLGGDLAIDHAAAAAAIERKLAQPLGIDARAAAAAVVDVVNHARAEALKIVSVQRGHDPRQFALAAFGGAGPAAPRACRRARHRRSCPPIPGAFSALGLIGTDLKRDYVRTVYVTTASATSRASRRVRRVSRKRAPPCSTGPASRPRTVASSASWMRATSASPTSCPCRCRRARSMPPSSPRSPRPSTPAIAPPTATTTAASRCSS
jgi:N-methylhydantoinase A